MIPVVSVKSLKTFESHDGGGFNATVYVDGKKFCKAHNGGYGGDIEYFGGADDMHDRICGISVAMKGKREYMEDFEHGGTVLTIQMDFDSLVEDAIEEVEKGKERKRISASVKRDIKKAVCFVKTSTEKGAYGTIPHVGVNQPNIKEHLRAKYKGVEFLDEQPSLDKFLDRLLA